MNWMKNVALTMAVGQLIGCFVSVVTGETKEKRLAHLILIIANGISAYWILLQ